MHPVIVDLTQCPSCGTPTDALTIAQPALFYHGGYGATLRTIVRYCPACPWHLEQRRDETRPR